MFSLTGIFILPFSLFFLCRGYPDGGSGGGGGGGGGDCSGSFNMEGLKF